MTFTHANIQSSHTAAFIDSLSQIILIVAGLLPLTIQHQTTMIFEPAKFYFLIFFCGMIWLLAIFHPLCAWELLSNHWQKMKFPLLIVGLSAGWIFFSHFFSLSPNESFWGNSARYEGFLTVWAWSTLFISGLLITSYPARQSQLINIIILGSIPVTFYAFFQYLGFDLRIWQTSIANRPPSTLGNPIFLGSYLIFPLFLTFYRIIRSFRQTHSISIILVVPALLQAIALILTQSRGPWLGTTCGLLLLILLQKQAFFHRYRWIIVGFLLFTAVSLFFFLPKYSSITQRSATVEVRWELWKAGGKALHVRPAFTTTSGDQDPFTAYRLWLGYGGDAIQHYFPLIYPPNLELLEKPLRMPDRFHNPLLDNFFQYGLPGLALYLGLMALILIYSLKKQICLNRKKIRIFTLILLLDAMAAFIGLELFQNVIILLLLPALFLATFIIALIFQPVFAPSKPTSLLSNILIAILMAFYFDMQFSFESITSNAYFYLCLALWLKLQDQKENLFEECLQPTDNCRQNRLIPLSALKALILGILFFIPPFYMNYTLQWSIILITVLMLSGAMIGFYAIQNILITDQVEWKILKSIWPLLLIWLVYRMMAIYPETPELIKYAPYWMSAIFFGLMGYLGYCSLQISSLPRSWIFLAIMYSAGYPLLMHFGQEIRFWQGERFYYQQNYFKAIECFKKIDIPPLAEKADRFLCECHTRISAYPQMDSKFQLMQAQQLAQNFKKKFPYSRMAGIYAADLYWKQCEYAPSSALYTTWANQSQSLLMECCRLSPQVPILRRTLVKRYLILNDTLSAQLAVDDALSHIPDFIPLQKKKQGIRLFMLDTLYRIRHDTLYQQEIEGLMKKYDELIRPPVLAVTQDIEFKENDNNDLLAMVRDTKLKLSQDRKNPRLLFDMAKFNLNEGKLPQTRYYLRQIARQWLDEF